MTNNLESPSNNVTQSSGGVVKKKKRSAPLPRPTSRKPYKTSRIEKMSSWELPAERSDSYPMLSSYEVNTDWSALEPIDSIVESTNEIGTNAAKGSGFDFSEAESEVYLDFGPMNFSCKYCGAMFWYEERSVKSKHTKDPDFSLCCMKGKVVIPLLKDPPSLLANLLDGVDYRSKHFLDHIRSYNSMFAFTSMGGKVDNSVNDGGGPPQFIISGQNYHRIGSLLPEEGGVPKFAQLYIYDTHNELKNRMKKFSESSSKHSLDESLVTDLMEMCDDENVLVNTFRRVRDSVDGENSNNVTLRLFRHRSQDARTYNLPSVDEVAALIVGDFDSSERGRDIILRSSTGVLQRMPETHASFLPLQYPLLFPYGEDGFSEYIRYRGTDEDNESRKRKFVSFREWVSFRLHERQTECSRILKSRRLFQQYVVDCYSMIESSNLYFIRTNQATIRRDFMSGVEEANDRGDTNAAIIGTRVVLPSSFTGGRRYMFKNCQDAMAICRTYGYPDLFLTMTCNPKWPEIENHLSPRDLSAFDRPDIVCRAFRTKLDSLMGDLKKGYFFGKLLGGMYTIEFQKRGLPHAHILLWLDPKHKLNSVEMIDKVICAELPDPERYPKLFEVVSNYMVHGPCGISGKKSPCMKNSSCTKFFPKEFTDLTSFDKDGYPIYRRRNSGITTIRKGVHLDNSFVVPYNPKLLMRYQAHINIEYCNKSNCIKYLFKYINKGVDRVTMAMSMSGDRNRCKKELDEIKQYYDCRYLSPCEAIWRTYAFLIHHHWPPVDRVSFHLPDNQVIFFDEHESIEQVLERNRERETMFTAWMEANTIYQSARELTYVEFPNSFIYEEADRLWRPRKQGFAIGRINYVQPGSGELYYLRLLLTIQRGCTCFADLRTVNGRTYETFRDACDALGLLADDREYIDGIRDAAIVSSGTVLRGLFVTLLLANTMSKPVRVWEETWRILADGIVYNLRRHLNQQDVEVDDLRLKALCLVEIDKILLINGKSLRDFNGMPSVDSNIVSDYGNVLLFNELNFDKVEMKALHEQCHSKLNAGQLSTYNQIMAAIHSDDGGFFFVYGYGGTGKTFLWKTLTYKMRSEHKIVLNVASSGIAALLLPNGRTAHSLFSIPIDLNEDSCCSIPLGSLKAELLMNTTLIIWDEAVMVSKHAFEALDRTLKDIMRTKDELNAEKPFGGKVVVLGGDFRQILPVIPKASRAEIVMSAINSSRLWRHCRVLTLTENMRLVSNMQSISNDDVQSFAQWVLDIGDGNAGEDDDGEADINIPVDLLMTQSANPIFDIVDCMYPELLANLGVAEYYRDRAILAPTLDAVDSINQYMLSLFPGLGSVYFSSDTVWKVDEELGIEADWLTTEMLNDISCSGLPAHKLVFKVGAPVMLMRNLDISTGMCNGTRLIIEHLDKDTIGAVVITGTHIGTKVRIPRMSLMPSDPNIAIKFVRRQFPLMLSFAMTINKSQGQTLNQVGLYLPKQVFSHGQLYVAISRVTARSGLKILLSNDDGTLKNNTKNIVYKEVFQKIYL